MMTGKKKRNMISHNGQKEKNDEKLDGLQQDKTK